MRMKSSARSMEILQDPTETPEEYLKDKPYIVFRNGQVINLLTYNMNRNKNFKPTKKMLRGIK